MIDRVIKCIAIDDEPIALSVITEFCKRIGNVNLSVYSDPRLGLDAVLKEKPDVVLLDIEMNDINGLRIAEKIGKHTAFIFTTAYLQYALDGFDLDAVDFLHKPFSYDRFQQAMDKARRRVQFLKGSDVRKVIVVKSEYANVTISTADIMYIEAMENYAKIYKCDKGCIVSHHKLKGIMEILPDDEFLRIHRSYIVPIAKIKSFNKQAVELQSGKTLPVGKQYLAGLLSMIKTISANQ